MTTADDLLTDRAWLRAIRLAQRDPRHVEKQHARRRLARVVARVIATRRGGTQ